MTQPPASPCPPHPARLALPASSPPPPRLTPPPSRFLTKTALTGGGSSAWGTWAWAAPEVLLNQAASDRADVFSVSVAVWVHLTGVSVSMAHAGRCTVNTKKQGGRAGPLRQGAAWGASQRLLQLQAALHLVRLGRAHMRLHGWAAGCCAVKRTVLIDLSRRPCHPLFAVWSRDVGGGCSTVLLLWGHTLCCTAWHASSMPPAAS